MSIAIRTTAGRHRAADKVAELEAELAEARAAIVVLQASNEQLAHDLTRTVIRASQDAMWRAQSDEENGRLKARVRELADKVIRGGAEQARLRQAVINARPKIGVAVQALDRPYVSHVQVPYPVPVGKSTANDETQKLPVIDLPEQPATWPRYSTPST